ncbi:hypothetical protein N7474_000776 [Penicillium riverlandense]|uniref:uncharacterized protein n=1 Tax=Penicillium riverlandense TaxID=1903569 RepID=UPI002547CDA1|nr:uncharacterized protein N7474_000776 [Penicillium riverlandense]KAJ5832465.1 hypothetical protein N7474_000776 [Penicillium riverlandense]
MAIKDSTEYLGSASWIGADEYEPGGEFHERATTFLETVKWEVLASISSRLRNGVPCEFSETYSIGHFNMVRRIAFADGVSWVARQERAADHLSFTRQVFLKSITHRPNGILFVAARFFVGFGNIIASNAAPLLLTEICHPQHRGRVTTVYNQLWDIGSIVATWITFGTFNIKNNWSWRIPSIFQALPTLLLFIFIWVVPESPRWLLSKERDEDALAVLAKYHANGNETDRDVQFEFHEIRETLRLEFEAKKVSGYLDFFQTKGNRYRLFLVLALGLFSQWSGNGLTSYYFALVMDSIGVTDAATQFKINGCKTILSLIVGLIGAAIVDQVGRRPLFLTATLGMFVCFVLWTACSALYDLHHNLAAGKTVIFFIFLHGVFYNIAWSGLLVGYTVEIIPYKLRAKGLMLMNFFVQAGLVFNQYINPIGLSQLQPRWRFYSIYCGWLCFEVIFVFFFFIETRGPTLEEIAKIFDGQDAQVANVDMNILEDKQTVVEMETRDSDAEQRV